MAAAIVTAPKTSAPVKGIPSTTTTTISPLRRRKEAPERPQLTLPASVREVLYNIQNDLFQVRAIFAGAYALADASDARDDVRWAMEVALKMFADAIESVDPVSLTREAAEREG